MYVIITCVILGMQERTHKPTIKGAIIKVTHRCNLGCKYCYVPHDGLDLSEEVLMNFLDEAIPLGLDDVIFHGGEPLLRPIQFYKNIVGFIKDKYPNNKINLKMMTNATLLTEDILDGLQELDIGIGISLDGPERIHNINRKNWLDTMKAVHLLNSKSVKYGIIAVVTNKTQSQISAKDLLNFYLDNGMKILAFNACFSNDITPKDVEVNVEDYNRYICEMFDAWLEKDDAEISIREIEDIVRPLLYGFAPQGCAYSGGGHCLNQLDINPDGKVFLCDTNPDLNSYGGTLGEDSLANIVIKAKSNFQKNILDDMYAMRDRQCAGCRWVGMCRGGCPYSFLINKRMEGCNRVVLYDYIFNRLSKLGYEMEYSAIIQEKVTK